MADDIKKKKDLFFKLYGKQATSFELFQFSENYHSNIVWEKNEDRKERVERSNMRDEE